MSSAAEVGTILKEARIASGMTLRELKNRAGMSLAQLHGFETGARSPRTVEQLLTVARAVRADEAAVLAASGMVTSEVASTVLAPSLRRNVRAGRLTDAATLALRQSHLRELAHEFPAGEALPVDVVTFLDDLGVDYKESPAGPAFESPVTYLLPVGATEGRRFLLAHAAGHVLLARDAPGDSAPACDRSRGSIQEREADYLAGLIAVPSHHLRVRVESFADDFDLNAVEGLAGFVAELGSTFDVPARVVAVRLSEDGHLSHPGRAA